VSDHSFETILQEMLDMAPDGVDTRQGSVFYDFVAPAAFEVAKCYTEVETTAELTSIDSAEGEYLDQKAAEHSLERTAAIANIRSATFTGASVAANLRFFSGDFYWVTQYDDSGNIVVAAEEAGENPNSVAVGIQLVPVTDINGLTSAVLGATITPGTSEETDTHLRQRLKEAISDPSQNGNARHYRTWCESITGIGIARVDALWSGNNTVRAVLIGTDGLPASSTLVSQVQEYVDPGGTGLGDGTANIGSFFTAVAATATAIDISFSAQLSTLADLQTVKEACEEAVRAYFKTLALASTDKSGMTIRAAAIANIIFDVDGVVDYSNLTIGGGTANINVPYTAVPTLGVMTIVQV